MTVVIAVLLASLVNVADLSHLRTLPCVRGRGGADGRHPRFWTSPTVALRAGRQSLPSRSAQPVWSRAILARAFQSVCGQPCTLSPKLRRGSLRSGLRAGPGVRANGTPSGSDIGPAAPLRRLPVVPIVVRDGVCSPGLQRLRSPIRGCRPQEGEAWRSRRTYASRSRRRYWHSV